MTIIRNVIRDGIIRPVIRPVIRGPSGPSYPPILDTVLVWRDNTTITVSGLDISGWTNKGTGGTAHDMISVGGSAATLRKGTINGLGTIRHDGSSNRRMQTSAEIIILAPYTEYIVFRFEVVSPSLAIFSDSFGGAISNNRMALQDNGAGLYRVGYISKGGIASIGSTNTIVNTIITTNDGAGSGNAKLGAAAPVSFTTAAGDGFSKLNLFADRGGTNEVVTPLHICERIFDDRLHTGPEQTIIHDYLSAKWGAN